MGTLSVFPAKMTACAVSVRDRETEIEAGEGMTVNRCYNIGENRNYHDSGIFHNGEMRDMSLDSK